MKKKILTMVLVIISILTMAAAASSYYPPDPIRLPDNLDIIPPDPNIGIIANCSGIWEGVWLGDDFMINTTVVLQRITATEATGIYFSSGRYASGNVPISGSVTPEGIFSFVWKGSRGRIELTLTPVVENGAVIALRARYKVGAGNVSKTTLKKKM